MELVNVVTALSRPENIPVILEGMEEAVEWSDVEVLWVIVLDAHRRLPPKVLDRLDRARGVRVLKAAYPGWPARYGIPQKNMGIDLCRNGFLYILDDDNIVHPDLFRELGDAFKRHPGKLAFAFGQRRWDRYGDMMPAPERMGIGKIDNSMFVVHTRLVGSERYNGNLAGWEDYYFFKGLHDAHPDAFVILGRYLAYYNYLSHHPWRTGGSA